MTAVLLMSGTPTTSFSLTGQQSISICGALSPNTVPANQKIRFYAPGIFTNFSTNIVTNTDTSNQTITLIKNSATAGNEAISITSLTTGNFTDAVNNDAVTAGDDWYATNSTITSTKVIALSFLSVMFTPTTSTISKLYNGTPGGLITNPTASTTSYYSLATQGTTVLSTTELAQFKIKMPAGTLQNFFVKVVTNTRSSSTTMGTRLNGGTGAQSVSIVSNSTGTFADTINTDTVSANDLFNGYLTAGVA